jgi:hypothetical protein
VLTREVWLCADYQNLRLGVLQLIDLQMKQQEALLLLRYMRLIVGDIIANFANEGWNCRLSSLLIAGVRACSG